MVRDPIARLRSAYLDKIRTGEKTDVQRYFNLPRKADVSFELFLDYLEQDGIRENGHWSLQKDFLYFSKDDYDYIGKVETLHDDLPVILKAIHGSSGTIISADRHQAGDAGFWLSASQKERAYKLYQDDFDLFDYSF